MIVRIFAALTLIFLFHSAFSQDGELKTLEFKKKNFKTIELIVRPNILYASLDPQFMFNSIGIDSIKELPLKRSFFILGESEKIDLKNHLAAEPSAVAQHEGLLIRTDMIQHYFSFFSGDLEGKIKIRLKYDKASKKKLFRN